MKVTRSDEVDPAKLRIERPQRGRGVLAVIARIFGVLPRREPLMPGEKDGPDRDGRGRVP